MPSTTNPALQAVCLAALLFVSMLTGCRTVPDARGFSPVQIAVLKDQGFEPIEDGWAFTISDKLIFDIDVSKLDPGQEATVRKITQALLSVGIAHARVEGYTDSTGTPAYNQQLSLRRAGSVADIMADAGMDRSALEVIGLGSRHPVASNRSARGRTENRRVVIIIAADAS